MSQASAVSGVRSRNHQTIDSTPPRSLRHGTLTRSHRHSSFVQRSGFLRADRRWQSPAINTLSIRLAMLQKETSRDDLLYSPSTIDRSRRPRPDFRRGLEVGSLASRLAMADARLTEIVEPMPESLGHSGASKQESSPFSCQAPPRSSSPSSSTHSKTPVEDRASLPPRMAECVYSNTNTRQYGCPILSSIRYLVPASLQVPATPSCKTQSFASL